MREPRIHFYKVPGLGSYLAIRLEYNSCLAVEAYNDGIKDALNCRDRMKDQEEGKRDHEEKEKDRLVPGCGDRGGVAEEGEAIRGALESRVTCSRGERRFETWDSHPKGG